MKNRVQLLHVYAGTQGTAGMYLNEIIKAINSTGISQRSFVSYYYPFCNAKRLFFKYTDLARGTKKSFFRPYLRYIELIYGLLYIFLYCVFNRPKILNYSLNTSYFPEVIFLILIRRCLKIKLIITCHDVIPFDNAYLNIEKEAKRRVFLMRLADYLLVHNDNSKNDLVEFYKINVEKIIFHPFPIMELNYLNIDICKKEFDFLFIGHLRKEKGVEVLLKAWKIFHQKNPEANLYIVGNLPSYVDFEVDKYKEKNVRFILNYVDDVLYVKLIASAKCVVLPYLRGTNSGIPSSVIAMGTNLIVSDIAMFKTNQLIEENSFFKSADSEALVQKMEEFYNKKNDGIAYDRIKYYRQEFIVKTSNLYENIINKI